MEFRWKVWEGTHKLWRTVVQAFQVASALSYSLWPHGPHEFSRHEYRSALPLVSLGDLPHPGIKPWSPTLQVESWLSSEPPGTTVLKCEMARGWRCKDCRRGGLERCSQLIHSPQPLCYTFFLPPFLPSLSSFIWLWESFLSSVEVLAFGGCSFLSGLCLSNKYKITHIFLFFGIRFWWVVFHK